MPEPFFFFDLLHQILIGDIFRLNQQSYILIVVEGKTRQCAGAQKPCNVPECKNHVVRRGAKIMQCAGVQKQGNLQAGVIWRYPFASTSNSNSKLTKLKRGRSATGVLQTT